MMHYTQIRRPAIAMIELIFAIVVIGIVLMTAPMLIQTAAKSGYVATQQEAINEAAARVNMIMGHYWDENGTDSSERVPILQTGGDSELSETTCSDGTLTGCRAGTPIESLRNFRVGANERLTATSPSSLGNESDEDDIDDFHNPSGTGLIEIESSNADYIDTISIITTVSYISDAAAYNQSTFNYTFNPSTTSSSNIKMIEAKLTSASSASELQKEIILRAFSCNIGEYELEERSF